MASGGEVRPAAGLTIVTTGKDLKKDLGTSSMPREMYRKTSESHPWFLYHREQRDSSAAEEIVPCTPSLAGHPADSDNMTAFLKDRLGEKPQHLEDPSLEDALDAIQYLFQQAVRGFVVFFSGHSPGGDNPQGDWLLPNGRHGTVLTFDDIIKRWEERPQTPAAIRREKQQLLIIADCCYSGKWAEKLLYRQARANTAEFGYVFLQASCRPKQRCCHSPEGSLFTLAYTKYADKEFHDGKVRYRAGLHADDQAEEALIVKSCDNQRPLGTHTKDASEGDEITFHLPIGRGFLLTSVWLPLLRDLKKPVRVPPADVRLPTIKAHSPPGMLLVASAPAMPVTPSTQAALQASPTEPDDRVEAWQAAIKRHMPFLEGRLRGVDYAERLAAEDYLTENDLALIKAERTPANKNRRFLETAMTTSSSTAKLVEVMEGYSPCQKRLIRTIKNCPGKSCKREADKMCQPKL